MSNVYWEWHIPCDQQTIAAGSCGSSGSSKSTRRDLSPIVETWRFKKWESPGFNRDISWTVWTIWIYSNLDMGIAGDSPYFFTEWTVPCKCGPDSIDRHAFPQSCNKQAPDSDQICRFFQCGRVSVLWGTTGQVSPVRNIPGSLCWWLRTGQNAPVDQFGTPPNYVLWANISHCPQCFVGEVGRWGGNNVQLLCVLCILCHAGCYARRSSLALAQMRDVTLGDLLLHLHRCGMVP